MKIFYLINSRIPSEKAEGLEAMKLAEALSAKQPLIFIAPKRLNKIKEDPFIFYNLKRTFTIIKLPVIDTISLNIGKIGYWLEAISFALISFFYILFNTEKNDIIYSHDHTCLFLISFIRKNCFYDIHDFPKRKLKFYKRLFKNLAGITTTNSWKKQQLIKQFNLSTNKILAYPNGVDLAEFNLKVEKNQTRDKLKLPIDKYLVGYVGMLKTMGMEKGIDLAIKTLKFLDKKTSLVLVGGEEDELVSYKKFVDDLGLTERVIFVGWVKHQFIPLYLQACDILIAPYPKTEHYDFFMSPMKIFEYMASGRPIVATDLTSIREILNETNSVIVEANDVESLVTGITKLYNNQILTKIISQKALVDVRQYSWEKRAEKVLQFMEKKYEPNE